MQECLSAEVSGAGQCLQGPAGGPPTSGSPASGSGSAVRTAQAKDEGGEHKLRGVQGMCPLSLESS